MVYRIVHLLGFSEHLRSFKNNDSPPSLPHPTSVFYLIFPVATLRSLTAAPAKLRGHNIRRSWRRTPSASRTVRQVWRLAPRTCTWAAGAVGRKKPLALSCGSVVPQTTAALEYLSADMKGYLEGCYPVDKKHGVLEDAPPGYLNDVPSPS